MTAISEIQADKNNEKQWLVSPTFIRNGVVNFSCRYQPNSNVRILISNLAGSIVKSFNVDSSFSIEKSDFRVGSYIASIISNNGIESHRFIIAS